MDYSKHLKFNRRSFLKKCAVTFPMLGAGAAYTRYFESEWVEVTKREIPAGLKSRIRIVHLSDMHFSSVVPLSYIKKCIELALAESPDLVCITGDFVTKEGLENVEYIEILKELSNEVRVFAVAGNHDGGSWVKSKGGYRDLSQLASFLEQANITFLLNQAELIYINDSALQLVGVGDYWSGLTDPRRAFEGVKEKSDYTLVLSHNPDAKKLFEPYEWNLMLCGHTHGGQCKIPFIGTPFAPVEDKRYVSGLNDWNGKHIYTTRGVGNLHGLRFNCRPEVSVLDLV